MRVNYVIAAYNDMTKVRDPGGGNVLLIGLEAFIPLTAPIAAGHNFANVGYGRIEAGGWYVVRHAAGRYDLHQVAAPFGRPLVATRSIPGLDSLAVDAMADWKVPGLALAVVQDGEIVLAKAFGQRNIEANLPVTTATQFLICSITKSFTATGVALLHNEWRLDWTKPVRDYIPEFRLHDAVATERITVRDLLCHQSGLPRHDWVHFPGDRSPAEMLGLMRHLELSRDIRAAWQYNNLCYNVGGFLIERVSGQRYEDFIHVRLTDKLGMTVSFTLEDLEASADAARP
jgi:CubicO group peptidase (beta-lactamase class C family)